MVQNNDQLLEGIIGSDFYKAPEIFEQRSYRGTPVDIYALGITLFVMAAKDFPFESWGMPDGTTSLLEFMGVNSRFYAYYF